MKNNNGIRTGKKQVSVSPKLLRDKKISKQVKGVSASGLVNRKKRGW